MEENYIFSLKYVPKISKLTISTTNSRPKTKNSRPKTKNSRIYLKTQAKKLNFRHFQNRWISAKCTKKKPAIDISMGAKLLHIGGQGVAYRGLKEPNKCPSMVSQNLTDRNLCKLHALQKELLQ